MSAFGDQRDIATLMGFSRELAVNVIPIRIGYYRIDVENTKVNIYGEAMEKRWLEPVLVPAQVTPQSQQSTVSGGTLTVVQTIEIGFLRQLLEETEITPARGDVVLWHDNYYQIDNVVEINLPFGADAQWAYEPSVKPFGSSWDVICPAHLVSPETLNLAPIR